MHHALLVVFVPFQASICSFTSSRLSSSSPRLQHSWEAVIAATQGSPEATASAASWRAHKKLNAVVVTSNLEHGQQQVAAWGESLAQEQRSYMEQHTGVVQKAE
ncbi:unnamed protein product [Closterium sp. Yama58-4]|nr:unnamed protein product [Closterium sp. Yama58-4]